MSRKTEDRGVKVRWAEAPKCAKCGDELSLRSCIVEDFPYLHADLGFICPTCDEIYLHGIPKRKDIGLALHVLDSNPKDTTAYQIDQGRKKCPFKGHGYMKPTKIFGDEVFSVEKVEYQWKCPACFLTRHELHDRKVPHGRGYDPTEEEMAETLKRLKKLGYIE